MRRVLLASGFLSLLGAVVVAAQPPRMPPPASRFLPSIPSVPARDPMPLAPLPPVASDPAKSPPRAPIEAPLNKFEPLSAFPPATQFAVRGVLMGSNWMATMNQPNGRFMYGYLPALRQPMSGDHDLRQAQAALALSQAAKFCGDDKQAAIASQAILALLASTKVEPNDPTCRVPVQMSFVCNRVGFAALLALAIYELPNPSEKLLEDAEKLCEFLRRQTRTDGSIHYTDGPTDIPTQIDPAGMNEYPGFALLAIGVSNRVRPADWKKDAVKNGVTHYHGVFRAKPHPMLAATITPAATELYFQTKLSAAATAAFEMNDWLCGLQIGASDPRTPLWAGGFRTIVDGNTTDAPPSAVETGRFVQSLACAYYLTRVIGDIPREEKYRPAVADAVQFLCGMQFLETNTRHFDNNFRVKMLMGGFHLAPTDGNLRIDATACAVTGLLRYLSCGAETR